MNIKEAWLLFQALSEGESEAGEVTVDVAEEECDGTEEESVGQDSDNPSFLMSKESSTEDEEPISDHRSQKRPWLLGTNEGVALHTHSALCRTQQAYCDR